MNAQTGSISSRAAGSGFLPLGYRTPSWMKARIAFNIFRVILGVTLLLTLGRYAWLGAIPLAWAAASFSYDYHLRHSGGSHPASAAAR
jgi:hypothetical protein